MKTDSPGGDRQALIDRGIRWFGTQGWTPFDFQTETWRCYLDGYNGLVNAPTGSGKTYSLMIPAMLETLRAGTDARGLQVIWITPIRALTREIEISAKRVLEGLDLRWKVAVRSGDTKPAARERQKTNPPNFLITTPESLHILLSQKGYAAYFGGLKAVIADEWHELMGSKRGVQVELALSRLKAVAPRLKVWGISATIGNMDQALAALLGNYYKSKKHTIIRSDIRKVVEVVSVIPDDLNKLPMTGHIGIHLLDKVIEIVDRSTSTLIFTNTRSFAEIWYQKMLDRAPHLAGVMAMHHGSISQEIRNWVENQLHKGNLKVVVCTSSLDLGVDFRPVESVIQVGSPKGVARFIQRAGRSGHQPGAVSRIYLVPTHALELMEASALRTAAAAGIVEDRVPYLRSFDVLIQYLMTLSVSEGFDPAEILSEMRGTFSFSSITNDEWNWILNFLTTGGASLEAYDEYRKVIIDQGRYKVENSRLATKHRLSIGTIVGDTSMWIRTLAGKYLGTIEEYFISRLSPGDVFWFAGRSLELVRVREMEAQVRRTKRKSGVVPSWQGGRMPLSSQMSELIRDKLDDVVHGTCNDPEMEFLRPLFALQQERSRLPGKNEFLVESFQSSEGYHVLMYPFEGRFVHEGMATLFAYRIGKIQPITFSLAMSDYGLELLSDVEIPVEEAIETNLFGAEDLARDIQASINATEMARRKFRDIAAIAGLVFKGYPGRMIKDKHLQSSSQLFFNVFHEYEAHNLLLRQAFEEVMDFQLEEGRLRKALERIRRQRIVLTRPEKPTPFAFPIIVDRLREKLSSEKLSDRIARMSLQYV